MSHAPRTELVYTPPAPETPVGHLVVKTADGLDALTVSLRFADAEHAFDLLDAAVTAAYDHLRHLRKDAPDA